MKHEERIKELEKEVEEFNILRLKKWEAFQQTQHTFRMEDTQIEQAILTRRGGIIELKRLISQGEEDEHNPT